MKQTQFSSTTAMVISHVLTCQPAAGNEIRIARLLRWLRNVGFRTVIVLNEAPDKESLTLLREQVDEVHWSGEVWPVLPKQSGIGRFVALMLSIFRKTGNALVRSKRKAVGVDPIGPNEPAIVRLLCSEDLVHITCHLAKLYNPSLVIAEYIGMSPCLEVVNKTAIKAIDTIDVFSEKAHKVLTKGIDDGTGCTATEERHCLLRADLIIAIQAEEASILNKLVPEREVITMEVDLDIISKPDSTENFVVTIVASDNLMNIQGIELFCREAWPAILSACPNAILRIIGKGALKLSEAWDGVEKVGWVADVKDEYRKTAVVVNPTIAGTGLKIKTVEALCNGKCVVTLPNGVEGLPVDGNVPFVIACSWDEMAASIITLLNDGNKRHEIEQRALSYAQARFSTKQVYAEFGNYLRRRGVLPIASGTRQASL